MLISDVRIEWPTLGQNIALQYYPEAHRWLVELKSSA